MCVVSRTGGRKEEEEARQTSAMVEKWLSQASWSATALTSKRDQRQRSEGRRGEWEREALGRKAATLRPVGALTDCDEPLQKTAKE